MKRYIITEDQIKRLRGCIWTEDWGAQKKAHDVLNSLPELPSPVEAETCETEHVANCDDCPLDGGGAGHAANCMASVPGEGGDDYEFVPGPLCPFPITIKPGREGPEEAETGEYDLRGIGVHSTVKPERE